MSSLSLNTLWIMPRAAVGARLTIGVSRTHYAVVMRTGSHASQRSQILRSPLRSAASTWRWLRWAALASGPSVVFTELTAGGGVGGVEELLLAIGVGGVCDRAAPARRHER